MPEGQAPTAVPVTVREFSTEVLRGSLTNQGPALTKLELLQYKERPHEGTKERLPVALADKTGHADSAHAEARPGAEQARITWQIGNEPQPPLVLTQRGHDFLFEGKSLAGASVRALITPRASDYALDYTLTIDNQGVADITAGASVSLQLTSDNEAKSSLFSPPADLLHGVCSMNREVERHVATDIKKSNALNYSGAIDWIGLDRQYFVVAALPSTPISGGKCSMSAPDKTIKVDYTFPSTILKPGEKWEQKFSLFVGPKREQTLKAVSPVLTEVVDYSIWGIPLGFLARPMILVLNLFHGWTGSWGVAIMLLTLLVKLLTFPVTYKSVVSMRRMQLLKPEMDKLRERYKDDKERQQMEQLKLFREKGVNPLGGCLPMLLQMPVWFALYRALWTAVDLYQQPFLWISDLTAAEPFPILALILGAVTFVQQKLTPTTADSQQAKMMLYMMPVMLTVFMIALPSGLVLYILVNSVLTIIQQLAINKREAAV